jgi:hypothetical protein
MAHYSFFPMRSYGADVNHMRILLIEVRFVYITHHINSRMGNLFNKTRKVSLTKASLLEVCPNLNFGTTHLVISLRIATE